MQNTPYPLVWLGDEGILRIDYGRNPRIDLAAISSAHAQHRALSLTPRPVLIRGEGTLTSTSEAEAFSISAPVCAITTARPTLARPSMTKRRRWPGSANTCPQCPKTTQPAARRAV
jgi:hypothetical protein